MRFLITGGAGFMGGNFVRFILRNYSDVDVIVYDKLTYAGRIENLHDVWNDKRLKFIKEDICNETSLGNVVKKYEPDVIINFAAETHVDRSINEPSPFLKTNVLGTFVILEVARKYNIPLLIHLSTDEVYGDLPENTSASEDYPLRPSSPYSASKASADLLIQGYRRTYGIPAIIVRPCNNYGPYQYPEKLIPKTIIRALHNRPIPIYGRGDQVRDWLFVEDFCKALDLIVRKGRKGEIYNIPGFNEKRNIDVVKAILKLMNKPLSLIKHVADRPGHDRRYSMVGDKIVALGWKPKTKWIEGLRKTIDWYLNNAWWWKPLLTDKYFMSETPWETTIKG